ncbi:hypothetical protein NXV73_09785 [Bacteroides salyersiae]|nr:hypothetical protein [Bacteroides salyersiae]
MKRLKIMVLCTLTVTLSSCLDMLNKTPISQLSVDKLFETVDGAEAAVAGCYSFLYGTGYYSGTDGVSLSKAPIYPVVRAVPPIINGLRAKTDGVTGGSPLIRLSVPATQP